MTDEFAEVLYVKCLSAQRNYSANVHQNLANVAKARVKRSLDKADQRGISKGLLGELKMDEPGLLQKGLSKEDCIKPYNCTAPQLFSCAARWKAPHY
jgi:hypothetical protein